MYIIYSFFCYNGLGRHAMLPIGRQVGIIAEPSLPGTGLTQINNNCAGFKNFVCK